MAFTQKSSTIVQRDEGEFPEIPAEDSGLKDWWSDTTAVLNRIRDKVNESTSTDATATTSSDGNTVIINGTTLSASQIKSLYEGNSNTNAFTDSEKTKLDGLSSTNQLALASTPATPVVQHTLTNEEFEEILRITGEVVQTISDESEEIADATINGGFF